VRPVGVCNALAQGGRRRATHPAPAAGPAVPSGGTVPQPAASVPGSVRGSRKRHSAGTGKPAAGRPPETKTARFLALVTHEHGPLAAVPLGSVARTAETDQMRLRGHYQYQAPVNACSR
jgi:hypothetical protein